VPPRAERYLGPCANCEYQTTCTAYIELDQFLFGRRDFQRSVQLDTMDEALDAVVQAFSASLRVLRSRGDLPDELIGPSFSALFDLCVTGIYTNGLLSTADQFSQPALKCEQNVVFPYTWMCPLCVARGLARSACYLPGSSRRTDRGITRDYPNVDLIAKPGGRAIGDQGIKSLKSILRYVIGKTDPTARLRDGGGARGEFDLTIATDTALIFVEVKAKPLIAYPLVATLVDASSSSNEHAWITPRLSEVTNLALLLGAHNQRLSLAAPVLEDLATWPMLHLAAAVAAPDEVAKIVSNWKAQADAYAIWENEPDVTRWHRFGCGNFSVLEDGVRVEKRVANTKELPGLDRTDDIKKGAAQVLKYSRLKFACKRSSLASVLMGNTHAITHHDDYVAPLLRLKVISADDDSIASEWIFDAVIGLTKDYVNKPSLSEVFNFRRALD